MYNEKEIKNFWKHVNIKSKNKCWNWTGYTNRDGYGNFNVNKTIVNSHRVSYIIKNGDIPKGMCVCHKCDNPTCVNPNHLFLATHKENMLDKMDKGRCASYKLSTTQKEEIKLSSKTPKELSKIYNVGGRHLARVKQIRTK